MLQELLQNLTYRSESECPMHDCEELPEEHFKVDKSVSAFGTHGK